MNKSDRYLFVHYCDGNSEGGVLRYGLVLERFAKSQGIDCESIRLHVDQPIAENIAYIETLDLQSKRLIFQLSHYYFPKETTELSLRLAALFKTNTAHIAVLHDANNLPLPISQFLPHKLHRHPKRLIKMLQQDRSYHTHLKKLTKRNVRLALFTENQKRSLPKSVTSAIEVVPHFVELPEEAPSTEEAKAALGLQNKRVLTILGYLNRRKGNEKAIDALKHLPDDYVLVLAGAPIPGQDYKTQLLGYIEDLGLTQRVLITGYLSAEMQATYIAATDLALCLFRKVSASGSLSTWISHEKRILASNLRELADYNRISPDSLFLTDRCSASELAALIRERVESSDTENSGAIASLREALRLENVWKQLTA